ncbi:hypothetical protein [uncultured Gammaproteobacteria bacterium]|nr:hypothetical protein [uncultured Gammaproteobacteria bacterium]
MNIKTWNELRIASKLFVLSYTIFSYNISIWLMHLDNPTPEQSAFATVIISATVPLFKWYMDNGRLSR